MDGEEISNIYCDDKCEPSRSRRRNRKRDGAAPRQVNPLKEQYKNLIRLWRENENSLIDHFDDVTRPFVIDVGCGEGEWACKVAEQNPDLNILGLEVRSAALTESRRSWAKETPNLALLDCNVLSGDLKIILNDITKAGGTVFTVMIQCPDPHWKKKNYKRRMLGPALIEACYECLTPQATCFLRTDVEKVAQDFESAAASKFILLENQDELLIRLCHTPTERMLYVKRKGGIIHQRTFRIRTDAEVVVDCNNKSSEEEGSDEWESTEPLFGIYG